MKNSRILFLIAAFAFSGLFLYGCGDNEPTPDPDNEPDPKPDEMEWNLTDFPEGCEPDFIGTKIAERFINGTRYSNWGHMQSDYYPNHVTYPDVCTYLGAFWFAEAIESKQLYNGLVDKFDLLFSSQKNLQPSLYPGDANKVDFYVFGSVPLYIYQTKPEQRYLDLGLKYADGQWKLPTSSETNMSVTQTMKDWDAKGYSWQTRLWIDDGFMITALQAQAYLATGDEKYIERAAREMVLYLEELQRPNGLFFHSPSAGFYWARGNGWMAVGMAEVLRMMPEGEPYDTYRETIMACYKKMMAALLSNQQADGMWSQLIDYRTMWRETSGSAMFTYAFITGVKNGWLDEKEYGKAARKGWLALLNYLNDDWDITEVCEGTGTGNSVSYYENRRRWVGDTHGQAAMLWCSYALSSIQRGK